MADSYQARYTDDHGAEPALIVNDGNTLELTVRDVTFCGSDFDALEPAAGTAAEKLATFRMHGQDLCGFDLRFAMPVPMVTPEGPVQGQLHIRFAMGHIQPDGQLDASTPSIVLEFASQRIRGSGKSGWFEDVLCDDFARRLPGTGYRG